jgi:hypothetical protein
MQAHGNKEQPKKFMMCGASNPKRIFAPAYGTEEFFTELKTGISHLR